MVLTSRVEAELHVNTGGGPGTILRGEVDTFEVELTQTGGCVRSGTGEIELGAFRCACVDHPSRCLRGSGCLQC